MDHSVFNCYCAYIYIRTKTYKLYHQRYWWLRSNIFISAQERVDSLFLRKSLRPSLRLVKYEVTLRGMCILYANPQLVKTDTVYF